MSSCDDHEPEIKEIYKRFNLTDWLVEFYAKEHHYYAIVKKTEYKNFK